MKIEFLTHYGHEYYCPLSLVRVHGMPMLEFYNTVESKDQYPVLEEEHLWPAEVREQIIQPQFDVNDTAESFPVKIDLDEDDVKPMIPPINIAPETTASLEVDDSLPTQSDTTLGVKAVKTIVKESAEDDSADQAVEEETGIAEITITQVVSQTESSVLITPSETFVDTSDAIMIDKVPVSSSSSLSSKKKSSSKSGSKKTKNAANKGNPSSTKKKAGSTSISSSAAVKNNSGDDSSDVSSKVTDSSSGIVRSNTNTEASTANSTDTDNETAQHHVNLTVSSTSSTTIVLPQSPLPIPQQPKPIPPNAHQKEGSTQESIYKTIMKRLNVLEVNMTLSQRFLDEQNKILNDVFMDMEKRHQDQLILLIGHLNETASYKIDSMKRRYEQWYEDLTDQTESDMREMTAKISILADQLSFERRVSVSQLVIMITLFVFMALSRGTFSTLSPVMAAQQEERKRRESIDQSSSLSKETLDILQKSSDSATDATVPSIPTTITEEPKPSIIRKLSELPKKPSNPRRHSDSPYHTMAAASEEDDMFQKSSYESLGIELHNELLHKKLDDLSQQQQQQQQRPALNNTSRKSSLENLRESASMIKNRKRSSTSPPMSSLAGLVNYSDDEGSSSSGDEAPVDILQNIKKTKTESQPKKPETIATPTAAVTQSAKPALPSKVPAPTSSSTVTMLEHNKRLMAALAAKPIEGVENWGIPDEPDTPCDAERQDRISHFLSLRASGHRLNDHLQHNKAFRNPRIYTKLVEFTEKCTLTVF
ncbi:hypothetical protein G6F42_017183 [Rhizopus arrhizus]|nr:hypothetical protein G6F42_017183 [Rhizopus arrhizus]